MTKKPTAAPTNPFDGLMKAMEQFQLPGVDMKAIVESRRHDMDALVEANAATMACIQELAQKQGEILLHAMESAQEAFKSSASGAPDPEKQAALARATYEKAVADMKDLAEMARKAQSDVMARINTRALESLQEIKALVNTK